MFAYLLTSYCQRHFVQTQNCPAEIDLHKTSLLQNRVLPVPGQQVPL